MLSPCPPPSAAARPRARPPHAARGRHARGRRRRRALWARSPSSIATAACSYAAGDPELPHDDAQRAEAVPGDAVRRGRRRRALRLFTARRSRCSARAIPASRGTSTPSRRHARRGRQHRRRTLQCGTHAPGFYDVRGELPPPPPYSPLAHNCSGKHSGMLAYCVQCGLPKESYLALRPSAAAGDPRARSRTSRRRRRLRSSQGSTAARRRTTRCRSRGSRCAFARLAARPATTRVYGRGARRCLPDAMTAHPEMVSGERRSDLALMRAGRGDWVTKIGAEGVQAIGVRSRGHRHRDQGGRRQRSARCSRSTVAVLDAAGLLDDAQRARAWRTGASRSCATTGESSTGQRPSGSVVLDKAVPADGSRAPQ